MAVTTRRGKIEIDVDVKGSGKLRKASGDVADLEKNVGRTGATAINSLTDLKSAFELTAGAVMGAVDAFDEYISRAGKLSGMTEALAFSIDKAKAATQGLIGDFELIEAANRGVALGVDLNAQKFADLAKAAAIVSRKMGTDVKDAIGDLMTGLGRQSSAILDNLGIIVKAETAYTDYAASIGKAKNELTDMEKRVAFQSAAMKALNKIAGTAALKADDAASSWQRLKTVLQDSSDAMGRSVNKSKILSGAIDNLSWFVREHGDDVMNYIIRPWSLFQKEITLATPIEAVRTLRREARGLIKEMERAAGKITAAGVGGVGAEFAGLAERAAKVAGRPRRPGEGPSQTFIGETPGRMIGELPMEEGATTPPEVLAEEQIEAERRKLEIERQRVELVTEATDRYEKMGAALAETAKAQERMKQSFAPLAQIGTSALNSLAAGMWDALDAAANGEITFAKAMQGILKSVLMGVAKQATIQALFETAKGIAAAAVFNYKSAGEHFAAAGVFAATAAAAGTAGIAIPPVKTERGARETGAGAGGAGATPARPTGGRERPKEQAFAPTINVYLDQDNPAAGLHWRKQISAELERQAR